MDPSRVIFPFPTRWVKAARRPTPVITVVDMTHSTKNYRIISPLSGTLLISIKVVCNILRASHDLVLVLFVGCNTCITLHLFAVG